MNGAAFGIPARNRLGIPAGIRIRGGCDDCLAYQSLDELEPGIYVNTVFHDDTCPTYRRRIGRRATRREEPA